MTPSALWIIFVATAASIVFISRFLASSSDIIAIKTGLGRSFIGIVMLATATSLPELGTGISSILVAGQPDLAAGDAFGSNIFNLLIIAIIDLFWRNRPILTDTGKTPVMIGILGIVVITTAVMAILIHTQTKWWSNWSVSPMSFTLVLIFLAGMYMIYRHGINSTETQMDTTVKYQKNSLTRALLTYSISALVIVGSSVILANTGDKLTKTMEWEASFVGTQFLALSTSLPELATSYAAIRLGAPELAISNVLGSNLFNTGLILFLDDLAYTNAPLWIGISNIHSLTAIIAILMTLIVIVGLIKRPRTRPHRFFTYEALALIALYVTTNILIFMLM